MLLVMVFATATETLRQLVYTERFQFLDKEREVQILKVAEQDRISLFSGEHSHHAPCLACAAAALSGAGFSC